MKTYMEKGAKFRVITGEEYTITAVYSNMCYAVDGNGGVSTFSRREVESLIRYWSK